VTFSEAFEQTVLGGLHAGRLVTLFQGDPQRPLVITVHGINGSPEDLRPVIDLSMARGKTTLTFAYDDQHRRLTDTTTDLASELAARLARAPLPAIELIAHSMGSRVALAALGRLQRSGALTMPMWLQLIAPPLGGFDVANFASLAPAVVGELIPGVEPGKDLGTASAFQAALEALRLPPLVRTTIFLGGADRVVDPTLVGFTRIVEHLAATIVRFPQADHLGCVAAAAAWLATV
jgi:pimeloyl-ACP methyl ester carboxylesterase